MRSRCNGSIAYYDRSYGSLGIKVCERWANDFEAFYEDMGPRPSPHHSIDRIDGNGNYCPPNCRWATQIEQCRNLRVNKIVTVGGQPMTLAEAAELAPVSYNTVVYRIKRGWNIDDAISRPAQRGIRP